MFPMHLVTVHQTTVNKSSTVYNAIIPVYYFFVNLTNIRTMYYIVVNKKKEQLCNERLCFVIHSKKKVYNFFLKCM